jgi:hypothetical protein
LQILRAVAASIEANFLLLGESDLSKRQDPNSWDKLFEMMVNFANIALGNHVNTRKLIVSIPHSFLADVNKLLEHWHGGRKTFTIDEIARLVGKLNHIAQTIMWLNHIMGHLYTSLSCALAKNKRFLISTNKEFRKLLKLIKYEPESMEEEQLSNYAMSETSKMLYRTKTKHILLPTAKAELHIIRTALLDPTIHKWAPIAHLIDRTPDVNHAGDSSLDAMGGFSIEMKLWWYYEWPQEVRRHTLRFIKSNKDGELITINQMEYATIIVGYAASIYYWCVENEIEKQGIPYPTTGLLADNKTGGTWMRKGCKVSLPGRALGRFQCALMMNSPVGFSTEYINTKDNKIPDYISRIKKESNLLLSTPELYKKYPSIGVCRRFHPSPMLISYITDALLSRQLIDPLTIRDQIQRNPGKIVGSSIAEQQTSGTHA